ncbi:PIN domain-containing protein [Anaerocolumna sp.]|uniref:PIN domain-containing protein n=1 Tax=Anaerocolumna sp. TaxID=2041569 RepID=UPI0028A872B0|nr:PIN domain-containing protein [Anaerocolumna sp.]
MKYILIDTNIFLDLLIDRKNQVSSKSVETFEKLLDYDDIKLIVPSIVRFETYKHIDEEFDKVRVNLQKAIKNIEQLYGINAYKVNGLDIKDYKKKSKKELQDAADMFDANKDTYIKDLKRLIEKVFKHKNTIIVDEDVNLLNACFRRRLYKKAPFHIEGKDSLADGMITETLININNYITLDKDSEIYFVTGNYTDFSDKGNRDILHVHIIQDLKSNELDKKVSYVRTFHQLIGVSLKNEVINANLKEEFQRELEEEQLRELQEMDYIDSVRESLGLSSLSSFESNFEDNFINCDFYEKVCAVFERINSAYSEFEDFTLFYDDELLSYFGTLELSNIESAIQNMNEFFTNNGEPTVVSSFEGVCDIKDWTLAKIKDLNYSKYDIRLPDKFEFGDKIAIIDANKQKSYFILDDLQLYPDDGGQDDIYIRIKGENGNIAARGYIQVNYGYVEEDDDGGIGDGYSEGVEYNTLEIEELIEQIASELECKVSKNETMVNELRSRFNL